MLDCPKHVRVTGAQFGSSVAGGTVLRCAGESHPPPSYLWTNAVDNTTVEGDSFTVDADNDYQLTCTVTNTITFANGTNQTCASQAYFEVLKGTYTHKVIFTYKEGSFVTGSSAQLRLCGVKLS